MANFYMRDIRAWKDSTLMLTFEERAYFDELLSLIYLYDGALPDNDELICRAMPVNKKVHLRLKKRVIEERLVSIENGFYFNSRATQELLKINSRSTQNKLAADKRWAKSLKNNKTPNANAIPIVKDESKSKNNTNVLLGSLELETEFLEWFDVYPKHGNAKRAREEFALARQRIDFDDLMKATTDLANSGQDVTYLQSPHNWLKYDGWDDPLPEKKFDPIEYLKELEAQDAN